MKLKEYQTYNGFKTVIFESKDGYKVEFMIVKGGEIEAQCITLDEFKECVEIIEGGKLEIIL